MEETLKKKFAITISSKKHADSPTTIRTLKVED
jgi:hypothetical protein